MDKNKTRTIILVSIVVFLTITYFIFIFLNKIKTQTANILNQKNSQEKMKEEKTEENIKKTTGYLVKLGEKSITFISVENDMKATNDEEKKKNEESFNIKLASPATPVTRGDEDNKVWAKLADLKSGQEVTIEYNEKTRDIKTININIAVSDPNDKKINTL